MAEFDCRLVAMFALAITLLALGGVVFNRHHHHHNPGEVHHTSAALVEPDCPPCDGESKLLSEAVLQCICEATTDCKPSKCGNDVCGIFRISQRYWADAGSPTVDSAGAGDASDKGYLLCVNNPYCAARTVNAYIGKYARDCDGNQVIDGYDYAAIHMLGPGGCQEKEIPPVAFGRLERCLARFPQT